MWLDPISVPISPLYKKIAITKMNDVYARASKVLVLDRSLEQVGDNWLERRLQLICSHWLSRLWTFQEGQLSENLFVQFRNHAVPIDDLLHSQSTETESNFDRWLLPLYNQTTLILESHIRGGSSRSKDIMVLAAALPTRATSVASDEFVVLATLLDLPDKNYASMEEVLFSCRKVCAEAIFLDSPRLQTPGFRWAPSTLLYTGNRPWFGGGAEQGDITPEGFRLIKDDLFFAPQGHNIDEAKPTNENIFNFYTSQDGSELRYGTFMIINKVPLRVPSIDWTKTAILLEHSSRAGFGILLSGAAEKHNVEQQPSVVYAHYEALLWVQTWSPVSARDTSKVREGGLLGELHGSIRLGQSWCID